MGDSRARRALRGLGWAALILAAAGVIVYIGSHLKYTV
jgi:hypothetical protein